MSYLRDWSREIPPELLIPFFLSFLLSFFLLFSLPPSQTSGSPYESSREIQVLVTTKAKGFCITYCYKLAANSTRSAQLYSRITSCTADASSSTRIHKLSGHPLCRLCLEGSEDSRPACVINRHATILKHFAPFNTLEIRRSPVYASTSEPLVCWKYRISAYRHIGYRLSSFWFPAVLCRGMAISIINRPDPGENLGKKKRHSKHSGPEF